MPIITNRPSTAWRRAAWFAGLWVAGVVTMGAVALLLRWALGA